MNTRLGLLGGLLAVQAVIVAALLAVGSTGRGEAAEGLLPFDPAQAVSLNIATDDEEVALSRGDDGWNLGGGLPADDGKVGEVLEKLAKASAAWPVATSTATAERFEVTEDSFQRRLTIGSEDGETATLFLGSSPGYRRVHARAAGADEVYSIDFSNYEAPADPGQWLDRTLLRPDGEVAAVSRDEGWRLTSGEEGEWLVDGAVADEEAADQLIGRFEDLNVLGIAGNDGEPAGSFAVRDEAGEYRLDFYFVEDEDDYSVTSTRVDGRFEIATYVAEQILIEADDLLPEEDAPEDTGAPESGDGAEDAGDGAEDAGNGAEDAGNGAEDAGKAEAEVSG